MTAEQRRRFEPPREEALEPTLPICDPHHHLWDYPDDLPEDGVPVFARQPRHYLLKELLEDTSGGHNIVKTVFIECYSMYRRSGPDALQPVGETEFVDGIAAQSESGLYGSTEVGAGIISFADLRLGDAVAPVLDAHVAASRRFRGIRHISAWDEPNNLRSRFGSYGLLSDAKFRQGFSYLRRYGLTFDAWLYHTQLNELADLARTFGDTQIVLDHIGGPLGIGTYATRRDEAFQDWKIGIASLAACANVSIKLGGMGMPMMGFGWHERTQPPGSAELSKAMAPHLSWCIEQFGPNRCMFESNFPVDRQSYSYSVLWNAFKRFSRGFSPADRAALFYGTAARVYRLDSNNHA